MSTTRVLVIVIVFAVAALVGVAYSAIRRHQGARWSDCLIDGVKATGATIGLAVIVLAFLWVTDATDANADTPPRPACSGASPDG